MDAANRLASLLAIGLVAFLPSAARAQDLTADEKARIDLGVSLIKLGCGTEVKTEETKVSADTDASFSLRKLPGVAAGGQVTYSKTEAQALAASLTKELDDNALALSQKQLDCMKPYVDRIFDVIFGPPGPHGQNEDAPPVRMTLLAGSTRPLDGYAFDEPPKLPADLPLGPVLPGGGRTRVVFQASDPNKVAQIDRVSVTVTAHPPGGADRLAYSFDPTRQPGFGAARPRQFLVRIERGGRPQVVYIDAKNRSVQVPAANILPKGDFPILELDSHAGLQEALDVTVVPTEPGFYGVAFGAGATSGGQEYELRTVPLYVVRR